MTDSAELSVLAHAGLTVTDPGPEPCLGFQCWSPIACGIFGYCRNRNDGTPSKEQVSERRAIATARKGFEQ